MRCAIQQRSEGRGYKKETGGGREGKNSVGGTCQPSAAKAGSSNGEGPREGCELTTVCTHANTALQPGVIPVAEERWEGLKK